MQPSTVLFLAANPARMQPLQLGEECRAIEERIRKAKFGAQIRFRSRWAARPNDLLRALTEDTPAVLHFSGHGSADEGLYFQSDNGNELAVTMDVISQVMRVAGASVTIVVLNACYSEKQAQALATHVPCVIGMSNAIGDEAAIAYAEAFYGALASGKSVADAHEFGLAALALCSASECARDVQRTEVNPSATVPILLVRSDTKAELIYITSRLRTRCVVVIEATLDEFNAEVVARAIEELRQLTGDLSLRMYAINEGSVKLTVTLSPAASRLLKGLRANGQLTKICGFDISDVFESPFQEISRHVTVNLEAMHPSAPLASHGAQLAGLGNQEGYAKPGEAISILNIGIDSDGPSGDASTYRFLSEEVWIDEAERHVRAKVVPSPFLEDLNADDGDLDSELKAAIEAGDDRAVMEILAVRYGEQVYRYCWRMLGNATDGEDVSQIVFVQAFQCLKSLPQVHSIPAWLLRIARNRCIDYLRAAERVPRTVRHIDLREVIDRIVGDDFDGHDPRVSKALDECLDRLDDKSRAVLLLRFRDGLTYSEISAVMSDTVAALRIRLVHALHALRRCLEGKGVRP